jgi:hypothetical protein
MQVRDLTWDECVSDLAALKLEKLPNDAAFTANKSLPILGGDAATLATPLPADASASAVFPPHLLPVPPGARRRQPADECTHALAAVL